MTNNNPYQLFGDCISTPQFQGVLKQTLSFIREKQLHDKELWSMFVKQFSFSSDSDGMWRCEYWGKMMRGACFVYRATEDEELYTLLEDTVADLLNRQDSEGRFSTYPKEKEFFGWDMWGRKYVMLGLLYFFDICKSDRLKQRILPALCAHADYICEKNGIGKDKKLVCNTSSFWLGVNSMSVLEPFCLLYRLTGRENYLSFAREIVREGYEEKPCIFRLAEENRLDPYQYPETKAYETMSCFDGLGEFYALTGEERYKTAVLNFGNRLLSSDVTVIGCCGCTHELFDHSAVAQTEDECMGIMQETCVTVTLMKLCGHLLRLSGDMKYADCMEKSFYNAYLGALNTNNIPFYLPAGRKNPNPIAASMPFDSYSPIQPGVRGAQVGGLCVMENGTAFYGCCACIGAAGAGYLPKVAICRFDTGILFAHYLPGSYTVFTPGNQPMCITLEGNYPYEGRILITLTDIRAEEFSIDFRIPQWSNAAEISINGEESVAVPGRVSLRQLWKSGDRIEITFHPEISVIYPKTGGQSRLVLFRYGCLALAVDECLGYEPGKKIKLILDENGEICYRKKKRESSHIAFEVKTKEGILELTDYASAGKEYGKRIAALIPCE